MMKTLAPRTFFNRCSSPLPTPLPYFRLSTIFLNSSTGDEIQTRAETFSTTSSSHSPSSSWRHQDEESKTVKVSVWWDIENCNIPNGVNAYCVASRITSALRHHGIRGPVSITAFGDVSQLTRSTQEALCSTGVCLTHVPHCGKNSSDIILVSDIVNWVSKNPPPTHFFLISGDRDFANVLHRLRMSNYNILLASTDGASGALYSAATIMWPWNGLVRGNSLTGKHFNNPPDGQYSSWYGHYKGVLDDPFVGTDQPVSFQTEDTKESITAIKPRPIPKELVNGIRQILYNYPKGISLSDLRTELKQNNISVDKDFFGYKKFSQLLLSIPNVLKINFQPTGDAQPLVRSVHQRVTEPVDRSLKPTIGAGVGNGDKNQTKTAEGLKFSPYSSLPTAKEPPPIIKKDESSLAHKEIDVVKDKNADADAVCKGIGVDTSVGHSNPFKDTVVGTSCDQPSHVHEDGAVVQQGFSQKIRRILFGREIARSSDKITSISAMDSTSCETTGKVVHESAGSCSDSAKTNSNKEIVQSKGDNSGISGPTCYDASKRKENEIQEQSEKCDESPGLNFGLFSQILMWFKFWKTRENNHNASSLINGIEKGQRSHVHELCGKEVKESSLQPETHDLFLKPHFWDAMESFLHTPKGSDLISKSRTREQLAQELKMEGPLVLNALRDRHLCRLVELLITQKKWVEESASQALPFKVTFPAKRSCVPSHARGSNGLSSVFLGKTSQSNSRRLPEPEKQDQNPGPYGNTSKKNVTAEPPQNLVELKAWFLNPLNGTKTIEVAEFKNLFEREFNGKLDCSTYGYSTMENLVSACLSDNTDSQVKSKNKSSKPMSKQETLINCQELLTELLEQNPTGFNMSTFRPAFFQRYGYDLDYQVVGYSKLASLLQKMPSVRIDSNVILPAGKPHPDSTAGKQAVVEKLPCSDENNKGKVDAMDNKELTDNDEGRDWEELGPVSNSNCGSAESKQEMEELVEFTEPFISDEEFSDSEEDGPTVQDAPWVTGNHKRSEDSSSSLLQILDAWHSSKEGAGKGQIESVDGPSDCSGGGRFKASGTKLIDQFNRRLKPRKNYSFVSDSGDDDKEKLLGSILGSLKKSADTKLQS